MARVADYYQSRVNNLCGSAAHSVLSEWHRLRDTFALSIHRDAVSQVH